MGEQPAARTDRAASRIDGRVLAVALVASYLGVVATARLGFGVDLWPWLGVPSHELAFVDALNVASGAECTRLGHDVLVDNPCDPLGRPLNYPRVWLLFSVVGMDPSWAGPLGATIVVVFLLSVWTLAGRLTLGEAVVYAAAVCAPAVMFGVERGQVDLVVFALVVAAVVAWRRSTRGSWFSPALVAGAAVAKLFPAVGLAAFLLARQRRAALAAVGAGVVVVAYLLATLPDVRAIGQVTPQGQHYAYGARILMAALGRGVDAQAWEALGVARQVVAMTPLLLVAVVAWWRWRRSALLQALTPGASSGPDGWRLLSFHLGALTYVGTFATANNWDYRLVFLLLCLPQLLAWARQGPSPQRAVGRATTAGVLVQLWLGGIAGYRTVADEVWSWALAVILLVLLVPGARAAWRDRRDLLRGQVNVR